MAASLSPNLDSSTQSSMISVFNFQLHTCSWTWKSEKDTPAFWSWFPAQRHQRPASWSISQLCKCRKNVTLSILTLSHNDWVGVMVVLDCQITTYPQHPICWVGYPIQTVHPCQNGISVIIYCIHTNMVVWCRSFSDRDWVAVPWWFELRFGALLLTYPHPQHPIWVGYPANSPFMSYQLLIIIYCIHTNILLHGVDGSQCVIWLVQ